MKPFLLIVLAFAVLMGVSSACANSEVEGLLSFYDVAAEVEGRSFDLKLGQSRIDQRLGERQQEESAYYPTLSLRVDTEYTRDFDDDEGVVSVGDSVSTDGSALEQSLSLNASYLLFDFGQRESRAESSRWRVSAARFQRAATFRDVRLETIDRYSAALETQVRWISGRERLALLKESFRQHLRMRRAGSVGQTEQDRAALDLAAAVTRLDDLALAFEHNLQSLSELTGQRYSVKETRLSRFPLDKAEPPKKAPQVMHHPRVKALDAEIRAQRLQLKAANAERWPVINLHGSYRFHGADSSDYIASWEDYSSLDGNVGLALRWNLFDGYKIQGTITQAKARVEQALLEREKAVQELQREIDGALSTVNAASASLDSRQAWQQSVDSTDETQGRLAQEGLIGQFDRTTHKIALIDQQLAIDLDELRRETAAMKLHVWNGGSFK